MSFETWLAKEFRVSEEDLGGIINTYPRVSDYRTGWNACEAEMPEKLAQAEANFKMASDQAVDLAQKHAALVSRLRTLASGWITKANKCPGEGHGECCCHVFGNLADELKAALEAK